MNDAKHNDWYGFGREVAGAHLDISTEGQLRAVFAPVAESKFSERAARVRVLAAMDGYVDAAKEMVGKTCACCFGLAASDEFHACPTRRPEEYSRLQSAHDARIALLSTVAE